MHYLTQISATVGLGGIIEEKRGAFFKYPLPVLTLSQNEVPLTAM